MEKIIYNNKLKKIIIVFLIFALLLNLAVPIAMADYDEENQKFIMDLEEEWKGNYHWKPDDVKLTFNQIATYKNLYPLYVEGIEIKENIANQQAVENACYAFNNEIDRIYEENKKDDGSVEIDLYDAVNQANGVAYDTNESSRDDLLKESDQWADGGILLEPVFSLVNFVADVVVSYLGEFMIGEDGLEGTLNITNEDIKVDNAKDLKKDDVYRVNTASFALGTSYYLIRYSPERIFSGAVPILSIDFISGKLPKIDSNGKFEKDDNGRIMYEDNTNSSWQGIRKVISDWYKVLRMIAIVGLLSVLIYTGIKIIISANAKDKAKYKEWILNWFMAVAILFCMHYIMSFVISVTNEISQLLSDSCQDIIVETVSSEAEKNKADVNSDNVFRTNLMGLVRFMLRSEKATIKIGYEIMYIALIVYTIKFTVTYLKRVLNMAFLTLIAPIVALTYPIDKLNDGKAQGFDMWLKEYIFNALLQPMHLVLYYILVGASIGIAASNPIYGIVVLAFMTEAERLLKKIFGFDKATGGTVGGMANAFAAGAVASNISKMIKPPKGNGGKGPGKDGGSEDLINNLRATKNDGADDLFGGLPNGGNPLDGGDAPDGGNPPSDGNAPNGGDATTQQRMLDAYDENFGTEEYDPTGQALNNEEQRDFLREQGMSEEEINETLGEPTQTTPLTTTQIPPVTPTSPATPQPQQGDSQKPIREIAGKFGRGMKNVGKTLIKPVWDADQNAGYNFKRLAKKGGRAYLGATMGIAAAAVQAGISITDGKYNIMEGIGAFSAGYAGGGRVAEGFKTLGSAYMEGTLPDDPNARKKILMERAKKSWGQREDVLNHNKNKYSKNERENVLNIQKDLLEYGIKDLKQMDDCIKYIKATNNNSLDGFTPTMVRKAQAMQKFYDDPEMRKGVHSKKKRAEIVDAIGSNENDKRILNNKFDEAVNWYNIVKKK